MKTFIAVISLALAAAYSASVPATPLEDVARSPVSRLEFSSLKLEVALTSIRDWPYPIEGVNVSYRVNPDQVTILVALSVADNVPFRAACARTLARVRQLLYVDADGEALIGRSNLGAYFQGPWSVDQRETVLRTLDASTLIRVDVVKRGSCQAGLIKAPVTFNAVAPK